MIEIESDELRVPSLSRYIGDSPAQNRGPTLVVVGGLHANEHAGIDAAQRVHDRIEDKHIALTRGRIVSLRGNLTALSADASEPWLRDRYIDEDLNRSFQLDQDSSPPTSVEECQRNQIIEELVKIRQDQINPIYLLDLHTVSSDSPAFVALEDSVPARKFASGFFLPKILGMEEELAGLLSDYATNRLGYVSCIVEAGRHDDPQSIEVHEAIILMALRNLGMIAEDVSTTQGDNPSDALKRAAGDRGRHYYDVRERAPIRTSDFAMQPEAKAFTRVTPNATVVALDGASPVKTTASGLLFLPNRQSSPRPGDDAFFVIKRVGPLWFSISAWVRKQAFVHKLLPLALPGVRRREGDSHAIVVAPEYAAILRRELLHLLGYRLVRWTHVPAMPWYKRIFVASCGLAGALTGMAAYMFRGGESAALPEERETDWVARRRHLDLSPPE